MGGEREHPSSAQEGPPHPTRRGHRAGLGWGWPRRGGMDFPGRPRARAWNRMGGQGLGGGERLGEVINMRAVWMDPIRPTKPGRREGGEASWRPQIGQGRLRVWNIFPGPMKTWPDRTPPWQWTQDTGSLLPLQNGTCWETNSEKPPPPGVTRGALRQGGPPARLARNQQRALHGGLHKIRLGWVPPLSQGHRD